jgi:hypothetical protein
MSADPSFRPRKPKRAGVGRLRLTTHELDPDREAMASSLVGQTRARMPPMDSVLRRTSSLLLAPAPNYIEVTALLSVAVYARLLHTRFFWIASVQPRVATSLTVTLFLYACIGKGQILNYLGWRKPRRPVYWLSAMAGGSICALLVIELVRITGNSLGVAPPSELLYGVTIGPIVEELIYRGGAFSVMIVMILVALAQSSYLGASPIQHAAPMVF